MPVYTYRREDGTTFDMRQRIVEDALRVCPTTGQMVSRVIQPAGIIFKGSGFYVNDNNKAKKSAKAGANGNEKSADAKDKAKPKTDPKAEAKSKAKTAAPAAS